MASSVVSDVSPWLSLAIVGLRAAGGGAIAVHLLRIGYKIRG
jgi:ABC-2 type transport system permease protein